VIILKLLEHLEKRGALSLLVFLQGNQNKPWMITELLDQISCSQRALYSAVQHLNKLKLIEEIRKPEYNRRYITLTEKGKAVAEKLQDISTLLDNV
jgi:DNA-binding MarR family transcriptional regulator